MTKSDQKWHVLLHVGPDNDCNDIKKDGLARLSPSAGPTKKKKCKASSEKVQKQGKKSRWGATMRACIPDLIPIGDDGRYVQVIYCMCFNPVHALSCSVLGTSRIP